MHKVLVTGGSGFIGGYVVEELRRRGYEPVVFDRRRTLDIDCELAYGDVRDEVHVTEAMSRVDGFIHLAAVLGTQETIGNPVPACITNIFGSLNILEAAAQYKLPGVYIGVGNHWMDNTYSISKTAVERFIAMYNRERGTYINIVRAMNAYGPRQVASAPYGPAKVRKITPSFVCRGLYGDPIEVYGDGEQISDMVYVGDVAKALVSALECANVCELVPPVEVGPKDHTTVQQFAEMVRDMTGGISKIVHLPMRPGEIPHSTVAADTSTLESIGMSADDLVPLQEGLAKTIAYFAGKYSNAARAAI